MVIENLPFDKYELEPSPLTQYILERKQPHVCWKVFVENSSKYEGVQYPFGYLKASTKLDCVNLFIMPYDYLKLLPLLEELLKSMNRKPTLQWKHKLDAYLKSMPVYYGPAIKKAFLRMGINSVLPEGIDNCVNMQVLKYLKNLKNKAREAQESLKINVEKRDVTSGQAIKVKARSETSLSAREDVAPLLHNLNLQLVQHLKTELNEFRHFTIAVEKPELARSQLYRNPFDIPRSQSLQQVRKMAANLLRSSPSNMRRQDEDQLHSMPVSHMGNYQEYMKHLPPPLRDVDDKPVRMHTFGNPFKVMSKQNLLMADEADVDPQLIKQQMASARRRSSPGGMAGAGGRPIWAEVGPGFTRQKRGPLPRDFSLNKYLEIRRSQPSTPSHTNLLQSPEEILVEDNIRELEEKLTRIKELREVSEDGVMISERSVGGELEDRLTNNNDKETLTIRNNRLDVEGGIGVGLTKLGQLSSSGGRLLSNGPISVVTSQCHGKHDFQLRSPKGGISSESSGRGSKDASLAWSSYQHMTRELKRIKKLIGREIRKPGQDCDKIFSYLSHVEGSLDTRISFIREICEECERFKKRELITRLNSYRHQLVRSHHERKRKKMSSSSKQSHSSTNSNHSKTDGKPKVKDGTSSNHKQNVKTLSNKIAVKNSVNTPTGLTSLAMSHNSNFHVTKKSKSNNLTTTNHVVKSVNR